MYYIGKWHITGKKTLQIKNKWHSETWVSLQTWLVSSVGATTLSIMTLSLTTLSITTLSIMTISIRNSAVMLNVIVLSVAIYLLVCWMSLSWVSLCWVSLGWMSLCWVSWRPSAALWTYPSYLLNRWVVWVSSQNNGTFGINTSPYSQRFIFLVTYEWAH